MHSKIICEGLTFDDIILKPKRSTIHSRKTLTTKARLTKNIEIDIPIISSNMSSITEYKMAKEMGKLGAAGALHRFVSVEEQSNWISQLKKENIITIGSIGVIPKGLYSPFFGEKPQQYLEKNKDSELFRFIKLSEINTDAIIIDVAHAHHDLVFETLNFIQKYKNLGNKIPEIIVGNVATKEAIQDFISEFGENLISAFKLNIGNGSLCTTRIVTGCGVPTLTAISECFEEANKYNIPVISDGGIRYSGDIVKAFWAGAETVMLGGILSGSEECPGNIIHEGQGSQKKRKLFMGMASNDAQSRWQGIKSETPEGVSKIVDYKGPVNKIIQSLIGGVRSGMSYLNATNITDLRNAQAYRITLSGMIEGKPHGIL